MKKLKTLIATLLISSIAFSEPITKNTTQNKDTIVLPIPVARAVVKDLIRKDSIQSELTSAKGLIGLLNRQLGVKDSTIREQFNYINYQKVLNSGDKQVISLQGKQISSSELVINTLTKDLKKSKIKGIFTNSILSAIILFLSYLVIAK